MLENLLIRNVMELELLLYRGELQKSISREYLDTFEVGQ